MLMLGVPFVLANHGELIDLLRGRPRDHVDVREQLGCWVLFLHGSSFSLYGGCMDSCINANKTSHFC